jgi:hypothetical protein
LYPQVSEFLVDWTRGSGSSKRLAAAVGEGAAAVTSVHELMGPRRV